MYLEFDAKHHDEVRYALVEALDYSPDIFIADDLLCINEEDYNEVINNLPNVQFKAHGLDERSLSIAEEYLIKDKVDKLEADLLKIDGVVKVDFDLDGFLDDMGQVIFLPKFDIPVKAENYFELKARLKEAVIRVAEENGLKRTEDALEDYGEHLYVVTSHDKTWASREIVIYQLPIENDLAFRNYDVWDRKEISPRKEDYDEVYRYRVKESEFEHSTAAALEEVFQKFNIERPEDFTGRSLSVSDVVEISYRGKSEAHFVDSFGFKELPDFSKPREEGEKKPPLRPLEEEQDKSNK